MTEKRGKMERIQVSGPSITQKEIDYVVDAVKNGWYDQADLYLDRFEKAFSDYIGVRYSVALPSCTSAIHLSLLALGVKAGDEVIVPDITWIGTSAPITYVGAEPVFADIDPKTWCLSPGSLAECINDKTKAIIVVDLYGNMPEMDSIREIAKKRGISVIEDAAESIGAEYHGRKAGAFGESGVFSFHGSKLLTTGEGGMLVTDWEEIERKARTLRNHGQKPGDKMFWQSEVAYKYKMSGLQAALGLAQLERMNELLEHKRRIFSWYQRELSPMDGLRLNHEAAGTKSSYWMVTLLVDPSHGMDKEKLMEAMAERNIDCRPFFYPLSSLPSYQGYESAREARKRNRVSYGISPWGLNLPCGMNMTEEKVKFVSDSLKEILFR